MVSKESFSANLKIETKKSIQDELRQQLHPVSMYKKAIEILGRMEKNFDIALESRNIDHFDGEVDSKNPEEIRHTRFEKIASRLKSKAYALLNEMGVGLALYQLAEKMMGKKTIEDKNLNEVVELLLSVQEQSKQEVLKDLEDGELNDYKHHRKIDRKKIGTEMAQLNKEYDGLDIDIWSNEDYDFDLLYESLPDLRSTLGQLTKEEKELIKEYKPKIILTESSKITLTGDNDKVIALNYRKPSEYLKVLKSGLAEYRHLVESQKELKKLASDFGFSDIFLWNNEIYNYEAVHKCIGKLRGVLNQLSAEEKKTITEYSPRMVLTEYPKITLTEDNDEVIALDWRTPEKYSESLKSGLSQYRYFKETNKALDQLSNDFGFESVSLWSDVVYDYKSVYECIPKLRESLTKLSKEERKIISDYKPQMILTDYSRITLNSINEKLIALDYREPGKYLESIKSGLGEYNYFKESQKALEGLAKEFGFSKVFLWDNILYDYKEVRQSIPKIREALKGLTPDEQTTIKKSKLSLAVNKTHGKPFEETNEGETVFTIDYHEETSNIVEQLRLGLQQYKFSKAVIEGKKSPKPIQFLQDPDLSRGKKIVLPANISTRYKGNIEDLRIMVARNLYIARKEATPQNISQEVARVIEIQKKYASVPLFYGRNVLFGLNNEEFSDENDENLSIKYEQISGGRNRFGTINLLSAIQNQGRQVNFIRPERTLESLRDTKNDLLNKIKNTPPPFTYIFDGHGNENEMVLMNTNLIDRLFNHEEKREAYEQGYNRISVTEIADCIKERYKKFPQLKKASPQEQDIFIFQVCLGSNFLRELRRTLDREMGPDVFYPIIVTQAEYGQNGFSEYTSPYGDVFYEKVMDMGSAKKTTLGTIIERQHLGNTNPTLWVPSINSKKGNRYTQIAKTEKITTTNQAMG